MNLLLTIIFFSIFQTRSDDLSVEIEITAIPNNLYMGSINKEDVLTDDKAIYLKYVIRDTSALELMNNINSLKVDSAFAFDEFHDFRAFVLIKNKSKKIKLWITGDGHIINDTTVYFYNKELILRLFSFLSNSFIP